MKKEIENQKKSRKSSTPQGQTAKKQGVQEYIGDMEDMEDVVPLNAGVMILRMKIEA